MKGDKVVRMEVAFRFLSTILRKVVAPSESDLPDDVELYAIECTMQDQHNKRAWMYLRSESFDFVKEGDKIPEIFPMFTTKGVTYEALEHALTRIKDSPYLNPMANSELAECALAGKVLPV